MNSTIQFDEAWSRKVEAIYTTSDVVAQRQAVLRLLAPREGERILDIGAGPGFLAQDLARAVGPDGTVGAVHRGMISRKQLDAYLADIASAEGS